VQRGAADEMRGRALTLVMSATFLATAAANVVAGELLHSVSPRWIWGGAALAYFLAALIGYVLAREPNRLATVEPAH
jgi:MFS family permease